MASKYFISTTTPSGGQICKKCLFTENSGYIFLQLIDDFDIVKYLLKTYVLPQTGGDIVFLVALWYGARVGEIGGVGQFGGWRRSGKSGRVVGVSAELAFQGVDPWIGGGPPVALARFAIS